MTLKEKIDFYFDFFDVVEKSGKNITIYKDNAPQELIDAIHEAHGDRLPDDYIYQWFKDILSDLSDYSIETQEDIDEAMGEIIDSNISVYTSDLTEWLNTNNNNVYYLSEVLDEYGSELDGFQLLSIAQSKAIQEVFDAIQALLQKES